MVFLRLERINEERARIVLVHKCPELLSDEDKKDGVLVDNYSEGKKRTEYWNYKTEQIEYEYEDMFIDKENQIQENITQQLANLVIENKKKDLAIANLVKTVAELNVKLGGNQ